MKQGCIVGIDLGGTNAQGAAALPDGTVIRRDKIPTLPQRGPEPVLADLAQLALALADGRPVLALGVGVPGLLDLDRGTCVFSGNLAWRQVPVVAELSRLTGAPVTIDNDVRVAARGEWTAGLARTCSDFIYLTVGTGIGAGIVVDGRLLQGSRWAGGEVGHMVLQPDGPPCTCGSRGCLEALASAPAIARQAKEAAAAQPASLLNNWAEIDATVVYQAAQQGDQTAAAVFAQAARWLGIGVANLVNIFNPRLVVIGGGVSLAGERLLTPVREQVAKLAMPVQRQTVTLALSALKDGAGVVGALELARTYLKDPGQSNVQ